MLSSHNNNGITSQLVPALQSTAEADGRLILHTHHAAQSGHDTFIIQSPDTDVEVLALYHQHTVQAKIIIVAGEQRKQRFVDIQDLAREWGPDVFRALPGLLALTGSDRTCQILGDSFQITPELFESQVRKYFISHLLPR